MATLSQEQERDIAYQLHPDTNITKHAKIGAHIIERGDGIYVFDNKGNRYIEGMAGLWSVAVGFNEPRLCEAATRQMQKLPYYHIFRHKTHTPSIDLAEKLINFTDGKMASAFFTNSGSEANDTVVKMVWYYNNALGRTNKKKFIARNRGYHGVTVASASLTGLPAYHRGFDLPLPQIKHTSCPSFYQEGYLGESEEDFSSRMAADLEALIQEEGPETVAAFIGEPIMGAGGVIMPPKTYWDKIQAVCKKYDILIVADEVVTGFGRLGTMFGSDMFNITPDIMVLSKQLTSSYQPLAAVLMSEKIRSVIHRQIDEFGSFGHGYTTSGHPVAAAVAIENLNIIEDRNLIQNAATTGKVLQHCLRELSDHPLVGDVRGVGLIAGVELVADKDKRTKFDPWGKVGMAVYEQAHHNGLIVRSIQDTIAFCPPLIITPEQVNDMVSRFATTLDDVYKRM